MRKSIPLLAAAFLALTFTWRASLGWMAVAGGQGEKLFAASLISTMLVASGATIILVMRQKPSAT